MLEMLTNLAPLSNRKHRIQVPLVRAFHDPVRNRWERLPEVGFRGWLVAEGPRSLHWEKDACVGKQNKVSRRIHGNGIFTFMND